MKPIAQQNDEGESSLQITRTITDAQQSVRDRGFEPKYYFRESSATAKTYDYYHPEKDPSERTAVNSILIQREDSTLQEISSVRGMERLRAVTGMRERRRYFYVPAECRTTVKSVLGRHGT